MDHPGAGPQLPAGDDGLRRHREVPDLLGQGTLHDVPVKGDGKAVVMVGGKDKGPGVLLAEVQLHIPRRRVGQAVIPRGVLHPPLPAVVDGQQPPVRHVAALKVLHVEVVEAQHHAGEDLVGGHGPLPGLVAKLPDRAAAALRQQHGALFSQ